VPDHVLRDEQPWVYSTWEHTPLPQAGTPDLEATPFPVHFRSLRSVLALDASQASVGLPTLYEVGLCFEQGVGVAVDFARARECYEKAAECGDGAAAFRLGVFEENGATGLSDRSAALKWYRRAVERGHAQATESVQRLAHLDGV
jgi:TPR repeat protein